MLREKMNLVSIIVPIYKVEEYLNRCIQSILNQTWSNFELILVDDGSPDQCSEICDEWAKKDSRIRVIHKENGGLSDARNAGLKIATGEFIAFVDSDDWVTPDYLQILLKSMKKSKCDIVECDIIRTGGEKYSVADLEEREDEITVFQAEDALKELMNDGKFHQYVWNKLYRRNVIGKISFEKGKTNEDEFWTYQIFGNAKKIGKIEVPLYYYYQRDTSIMGIGYSVRRLDALEAKQQRQKYIEEYYPKLKDSAKINLFTSCIYQGQMTLLYLKGEERARAKRKICHLARESMPKAKTYITMDIGSKMWIAMAKYSFWGTCRLKNLLKRGF